MVTTIAELQPVFKTKTKHVIQCFTKVKKVFISPNFRITFFWIKDWMRVSRLKLYYFDDFFCTIIVCWICIRVLMPYKIGIVKMWIKNCNVDESLCFLIDVISEFK